MTRSDKFRSVGMVKRFCEMIGPLGAIVCAIVCLGLPTICGALGILGNRRW
jgi:hypothetical protein